MIFTTIDDLYNRIVASATLYDVKDSLDATLTPIWINQAIEDIQRRYQVLVGEFTFNIVSGQSTYDLAAGSVAYPYKIEHALYAYNTAQQKELSAADHSAIMADLIGGNTIVYRYAYEWTGTARNLILNANPASSIPNGLFVRGPYFPLYVTLGNALPASLPFEPRFDEAVAALTMQRATTYYLGDKALSGKAEAWVAEVLSRLDKEQGLSN